MALRIVRLSVAAAICGAALLGPAPTAESAVSRAVAMAQSVNASRAAYHLRPLALRYDLSVIARAWAFHMAKTGRLAHNANLTWQVWRTGHYRWVGENVGYGPNWQTVQRALMRSAGHRANILSRRFTQMGIAVVAVGSRVWVCQVFRQPGP